MVLARPIPVTELRCQATKEFSWREGKEDVILNREIYTRIAFINEDSEFACKLPAAQRASLNLEAGIPSNEGGPVRLDFYLNGNRVYSDNIYSGSVTYINIPLTGQPNAPYMVERRRTLSVETTCLNARGCGDVRLFKADLEIVASPGSRDK